MVDTLLAAHLAHLTRLNRRPRGIRWRGYALARCARAIAPTRLLEATVDELRVWVERPSTGPSTQKNEVNHLRGFYRWCVREGLREDDPTIRLEWPEIPRGLPRPMPAPYVRYTLARAPARLRPWYFLAAYAGLRACEVAPLHAGDITATDIIVREGKGGSAGVVPIAPVLRPVLDDLPDVGWLFPHQSERLEPGPVSANQVQSLANRWLHAHDIPQTFHTLRHWFGTEVYRVNRDLRMAQRLLRHKSSTTTELYTLVDDVEAAATIAALPDLVTELDELAA